MRNLVPRLMIVLAALYVGVASVHAQSLSSADQSLEDEINAPPPVLHRPKYDPSMKYAGFKQARETFVQELKLLEADLKYEKAIASGEHPNVPDHYIPSNKQLDLVSFAALRLKGSIKVLKAVLNLLENNGFDPQQKREMLQAIADAPSADKYLPPPLASSKH